MDEARVSSYWVHASTKRRHITAMDFQRHNPRRPFQFWLWNDSSSVSSTRVELSGASKTRTHEAPVLACLVWIVEIVDLRPVVVGGLQSCVAEMLLDAGISAVERREMHPR